MPETTPRTKWKTIYTEYMCAHKICKSIKAITADLNARKKATKL